MIPVNSWARQIRYGVAFTYPISGVPYGSPAGGDTTEAIYLLGSRQVRHELT